MLDDRTVALAAQSAVSEHAVLSASAAYRWIACPGSVSLSHGLPDTAGAAAAEGTLIHELGELAMRSWLLGESVSFPEGRWTPEQYELIANYRDHVKELSSRFGDGTDPLVFVEQRVSYSAALRVPAGLGHGTADLILYWPDNGTLLVVDLKTGRRPVRSSVNPQGMLYARGAADLVSWAGDVQRVVIAISQGRTGNWSDWETSIAEIDQWITDVAAPAAQNALSAKPRFHPGDHCEYCKAAATCATRAGMLTAVFDDRDDVIPGLLSPDQVADLLPKAKQMINWATNLLSFAEEQAVKFGQAYRGFKVVAGKAVRVWRDEGEVAQLLQSEGYQPQDIYTRKLIGITAAEKLLGKKHPVFELTLQRQGAPQLVPESDPRSPHTADIDANFEE